MQNSEGLISVIVPIYNKEKYLDKCLMSILNQTYTDLEIILINDGSTDSSKEICERYAKSDNRIKFVSTKNRGSSRARNTAIDMATGNFISFIDADDYVSDDYYEHLYGLLCKYDADIVRCGYIRILEDDDFKFVELKGDEEKISAMNNIEALTELYGMDEEMHDQTVVMCNKLFRRELFHDIRYVENRVIDDETIIYKLIYKCKTFVTTNREMYGYVQSLGSLMRQDFSRKRLDDSLKVYDECSEFFRDTGDTEIQAYCLKRNLLYCIAFVEKVMNSSMEDKDDAIYYIKEKFKEKLEILEDAVNKNEELRHIGDEVPDLVDEFETVLVRNDLRHID